MVSENVWAKIQPCMCRGPLSSPHFVLVCFLPSIYLYHECKLPVPAWMFLHLWARKKCTIVCRLHTCDNLVRVSWWFHLKQLYTVWKARVQEQTLAELCIAVLIYLMFHLRSPSSGTGLLGTMQTNGLQTSIDVIVMTVSATGYGDRWYQTRR